MTVKQLKKILKGLPKNMTVVIGIGESLEDICPVSSQPLMFEYEGETNKQMVFVLSECTCEDEIVEGENQLSDTFINPN